MSSELPNATSVHCTKNEKIEQSSELPNATSVHCTKNEKIEQHFPQNIGEDRPWVNLGSFKPSGSGMYIAVVNTVGQWLKIAVESSDTIEFIKKEIQREKSWGYEIKHQRLYAETYYLVDPLKTLSDYEIRWGDALKLNLSPN